MRSFGAPPTAEEIEEIARGVLKALPAPFADSLEAVVLLVSGIYEGVPLTQRSVEQSGTLPERIRLFRRPILDEWSSSDDTLEHLVAHVLVHEVGHHFGLSDDDMHALEDSVA